MQQLVEGALALGLHLASEQQAAFQLYYEELVAWNARFNLTAVTDYEAVQIRLFLDSLSCLQAEELRNIAAQPSARTIDVGSGAGFPGLPLKLVCPSLRLTLLEATGKKVTFLQHMVQRLGLQDVTAIHARAEELARDPAHREKYDLALARAVAELSVLAEYTLPFCKVGGCVVAQKGESGADEARAAHRAISLLGGGLHRIVPVQLPGLSEDRCLVVIPKISPTPDTYPRRSGIPSKRPL